MFAVRFEYCTSCDINWMSVGSTLDNLLRSAATCVAYLQLCSSCCKAGRFSKR